MRLLYLAPRPCKALPPGPQAAPLPPDPLRPAAFWKKLSPTSKNSEPLPVQGVTSVMKMPPSSGKRMTCAPHCFSLPKDVRPSSGRAQRPGLQGPSARFESAS